jgi:thioredoxin-related protein
MKRTASLYVSFALAALSLTACERQSGAPDEAAAVTSPAPPVHGDAPANIDWFEGSVEQAFAAAAAQNKPVLLYWGAVWCPYCQDLKAYVFSRRDVQEKLQLFVPVYLDGDDPGAQKWGETFAVAGYPTVLALLPDRTELARIAGGMDVSVYADTLDLVLGDVRPLNAVLASLDEPGTALSPDDCARLAFNGWALDDYPTPADERQIAGALSTAAASCPADARIERARLTVIAAAYAADADAMAIEAGDPPPAQLVRLVDASTQLLADHALAASIADALQYLGDEFFAVTAAHAPARADALLEDWSAAMDSVASDAHYTEGDRLLALNGKLAAVKVLSADGQIPAELAADAKRRMQEAFERVGHTPGRPGLVNAAINLLVTLDDAAGAFAIAEQEMKTSKTPYYYMGDMAALEEMMGHDADAIDWFERAYRASEGPATRFEWGTDYVRGLIRLRPNDDAAIRAAAIAVLGELDGPERIYRRSRGRLETLDTSLREWNAGGTHDDTLTAIRRRMSEICAGIPPAENIASSSCQAFLSGDDADPVG